MSISELAEGSGEKKRSLEVKGKKSYTEGKKKVGKGVELMYAMALDLKIEDLKEFYGDPYNNAYDEIRQELDEFGFEWTQGSLYINRSDVDSLAAVYKAISRLSEIDWFKKSIRDIKVFKVEDWSDFTDIVKG